MSESSNPLELVRKLLSVIYTVLGLIVFAGLILIYAVYIEPYENTDVVTKTEVVKPDVDGLVEGEGREVVATNCTVCHSAKLITQNRATREGWQNMIKWMQETQNLWQLGDNEVVILDYLEKYYAPEAKGRRQALKNIEWYELED